jgi:hypothetical protein
MKRIVLPILLAIAMSACSNTGNDLGSDSLRVPSSDKRNPDVPYVLTSSQEPVYAFASREDLNRAGLGQVNKINKPGILLKPNVRYILLDSNLTFRSKASFGGERDADAMKIVMPNNEERFVAARTMKILKARCQIDVEKNNDAVCDRSSETLIGEGRFNCLLKISERSDQCEADTISAVETERQLLSRNKR